MSERLYIQIPESAHKQRLEDFLFAHFGGLSRMYLRKTVRDGRCEVNGRHENVGYRVRRNDFIEIELDLSRENSMRPQEIPVEILFEDAHFAVVNKPAGMLVHPTNSDKSGTLLNALAYHFNSDSGGGEVTIRPGLIHRLDRETSGLMVIAKTTRAHRSLSAQFQRKYVEKRYVALVDGTVATDEGVIDLAIGRYPEEKRWDVKLNGKQAETRFQVRNRFPDRTLLELEPVTGRTNQLRIHCAALGHPIIGDVARGGRPFERLCLHAYRLVIRHPVTRDDLEFEVPVPTSFAVPAATDRRS